MSKKLIARLRDDCDDGARDEAADLIEQQQKRINELEADTQEVNAARIYLREQERLLRQLAAAQAQLVKLREALEEIPLGYALDKDFECVKKARALLNQTDDTTALREMLKAERERCAKRCEEIDVAAFGSDRPAPNDCAAAIRAMEDK